MWESAELGMHKLPLFWLRLSNVNYVSPFHVHLIWYLVNIFYDAYVVLKVIFFLEGQIWIGEKLCFWAHIWFRSSRFYQWFWFSVYSAFYHPKKACTSKSRLLDSQRCFLWSRCSVSYQVWSPACWVLAKLAFFSCKLNCSMRSLLLFLIIFWNKFSSSVVHWSSISHFMLRRWQPCSLSNDLHLCQGFTRFWCRC